MIDSSHKFKDSISSPAGQISGPVQARSPAARKRIAKEASLSPSRVVQISAPNANAPNAKLSHNADRHRLQVHVQDIQAGIRNRTANRHSRQALRSSQTLRAYRVGAFRGTVGICERYSGEPQEPISAKIRR